MPHWSSRGRIDGTWRTRRSPRSAAKSAATLIQSSWRTHVARREFEETLDAIILAQSLWRARLARAEVARRRVAARESGKLMQDKENLERKVATLQELAENLKNQRNDLRKQLKQEKADRAEVESLLRGELEQARNAPFNQMTQEVSVATELAATAASRHESRAREGRSSRALAEKAAVTEELGAGAGARVLAQGNDRGC